MRWLNQRLMHRRTYRIYAAAGLFGAAVLSAGFFPLPEASASVPGENAAAVQAPAYLRSVRLHWPVVTGAVQYQVVILKSAEDTPGNIVRTMDQIFTNGVEVRLSAYGEAAKSYYWKVCPLDYQGKAIGPFSTPKPIVSAGNDFNPTAPEPTTEFNQMDYAPVYPVYSWIPTADAKHHEVQVWRKGTVGSDTLVRTLHADEYDVYEDGGYTSPGSYYWRVRAVTSYGTPISDWSPRSSFEVTTPTPVAALGDSITHGGGVISVPPGYMRYDWETYSPVPVKNIGFSGNTTDAMLERFERDVLPFRPNVLVIMGGVNDYRGGTLGWTTVQNLEAIRDKCLAYGIIPVFATVTPIQPALFSRTGIETPPSDWKVHQTYINDWIMQQKYAVDVSTMLTDADGCLRRDYTTDGLHPDYTGKRYIGETIGNYLMQHFSWLTSKLKKKIAPES